MAEETTRPVESEGVELENEKKADQPELSGRDQKMAEIVAASRAAGRELAEEEQIEPELVTVKIYGEERQVPAEEIEEAGGIEAYQKSKAADEKLLRAKAQIAEEKAQADAEIKRKREELERMEKELLSKKEQEDQVDAEEFGKSFAANLYEDDDKVAETMATLKKEIEDLKRSQRDTSEVAQEFRRTTDAQKAKTMQEIVDYYHNTYGDIAKDPEMHGAMNRRLALVKEESPDLSPTEVIDEAARLVSEKFSIKPKPSRRELKENMKQQPRAASVRKPPPPPPERKTPSDVLNDMRKHRGGRAY